MTARATDLQAALAESYTAALRAFLEDPDEAALANAYAIGRRAFGDGCGVLEMAAVHARALSAVLDEPLDAAERTRRLDAVERFFGEVLSPFEMAHRGFREANTVLENLNAVLEGQAKRIGYALHDEASQIVATMHLALADAASRPPQEVPGAIQNVRGMLDQIGERLRDLSHELRPPILNDLGLVPALEFLAEGVSKRWGLPVTVHAATASQLPAMVEATLYRVTHEALTNVARHARATTAEVSLVQTPHRVKCSIRDDGVGFDAARKAPGAKPKGLGLAAIEERVAALGGIVSLRHNDAVPHGTDLTVEIPLEK
jgi:signal transduction histidine kinase